MWLPLRGLRWTTMRNIIISLYQPSHLSGLIPTMESYIERAARNLNDGGEVIFSKLALTLFTDVIGHAAFGADFGLSGDPVTSTKHTFGSEHPSRLAYELGLMVPLVPVREA